MRGHPQPVPGQPCGGIVPVALADASEEPFQFKIDDLGAAGIGLGLVLQELPVDVREDFGGAVSGSQPCIRPSVLVQAGRCHHVPPIGSDINADGPFSKQLDGVGHLQSPMLVVGVEPAPSRGHHAGRHGEGIRPTPGGPVHRGGCGI